MPDSQPILEVHDLHVHFKMLAGIVRAVDGVDFTVERGRCLGIVGESGCGKSVTARSILRLLPSSDTSGQILYHPDGDGQPIDLVSLDAKGDAIRAIRGKDIAMIFQEPMTSLTPVYTIGEQIMESIRQHQNLTEEEAQELAISMLNKVGIPDAERRFGDYPHQMSGGMRQRVMIAIALCCEPRILIADEPTTALDVTIQAQILELVQRLAVDRGLGVILVTHNLGMVASICDRVMVMYAGQIVEEASVDDVFARPAHPYTVGLLDSQPDRATGARLAAMAGGSPTMTALPPGCRFEPRCAYAEAACSQPPDLWALGSGQTARCWVSKRHGELPAHPDGEPGTAGSGTG